SAATIARDANGVPVITAASRADLAFATGYAHGQDRFFQMDLIRRQAAGELSAVFGANALGVDKRNRLHRFRARATRVLELHDAAERQVIQRYADGVNAGLESLGARPFEYLLLRQTPTPWLAEDSILVVYAMFMQLNDERARKDVRRGYLHRMMAPEVFDWLYPDGTPLDAPLMGDAREPRPIPPAELYSARESTGLPPPAGEKGKFSVPGSNNWAVSGALTTTGRAMVSNDMHLGLRTPNIYYRARLVQTGDAPRDVSGVLLPGTPFVVAGSNGSVAWGYTNSYGDWSDAVRLVPGDEPGSYRTPDRDLRFRDYNETIEVSGGDAQELVVRETIWGPVDDSIGYPDGEIAISWTAHDPRAINLNILKLETASSAAEAMDIANTMGIPPQNFVVGDADGHIGWTIAGRIPVRGDYDPRVPADWSEAEGWTGWREPGEYPRIVDPSSGRIWTANSRVADGEALRIIGDGGYDLAARTRQIRDGLLARERFAPETMLEIQLDDRALLLARWRDLLLATIDEAAIGRDPRLADYRDLVDRWEPRAIPTSVGYRLVRGFRLEVRKRVFYGLMGPVREHYGREVDALIANQFEGPLWQLVNERPAHLLSGEYADWDALLVSAASAHIDWLKENYPGPLSERTWGEYQTAAIRHPLTLAVPALSDWLNMPRDQLSGDDNMPRAQSPGFGASERFTVSPGDEANGILHMPTGQSGHPMSAFYRAGHEDWVAGRPSPFLPGPAEFTLTLMPAGGTLDDPGDESR
ncbi:MAG: penicillin acylase family protein, partial [Pseudomonadota bacterium]